jgi:hypothetical protein
MYARPQGLRPWRCLTWPARVTILMITVVVLFLEVREGVALPTAVGVVLAALAVTRGIESVVVRPAPHSELRA